MGQTQFMQAPRFEMWVMAIGVAVVAAGVAYVVGGFSYTQAGFVGLLLALVVIVAFGFAGKDRAALPAANASQAPVAAPAPMAVPATVAAPVAALAPVAAAAPVMAAAPVVAAAPVMAPALVMAAEPAVAAKPAGLSGPRGGKADDLKIVKGIGPKLELLCHKLGFYHFDQLANWTAGELAWVDDNLEGFKGRVTRDRWQPQATAIVSLGPDEFLRQLDAGKEF